MVRKLDALQDDPSRKQVFHVHFTQHPPLTCIEAPVTVFDIAVVKDTNLCDMERKDDSAPYWHTFSVFNDSNVKHLP